jgi:hypothetical protein
MFQNRISRYFEAESLPTWDSESEQSPSTRSQLAGMVLVPAMAAGASWQGELYRMAYEQAVIDLEPPRHFDRYFSAWN